MAKAKKPSKPYNWHTKLVSAIRKVWKNSSTRKAALAAAKDPLNPKHVICANCNASVHVKLSKVEHLQCVVPVTGFDNWDAYIERMQSANLAVYCEVCAKEKTQAENQERKLLRPKKPKKEKSKSRRPLTIPLP
jgi:hypothetical protein